MIESLQNQKATSLATIIAKHEAPILEEWMKEISVATRRGDLIKDSEIRDQPGGGSRHDRHSGACLGAAEGTAREHLEDPSRAGV
jgi:hypothetical protein